MFYINFCYEEFQYWRKKEDVRDPLLILALGALILIPCCLFLYTSVLTIPLYYLVAILSLYMVSSGELKATQKAIVLILLFCISLPLFLLFHPLTFINFVCEGFLPVSLAYAMSIFSYFHLKPISYDEFDDE